MTRPIALLTDFGTRDWYSGVLKGVLLTAAPTATLIDISHDVPPQDVLAGAFMLNQSARWFPPGTVFLCIIDPGVGSARRMIAVEDQNRFFVAPDNGVLSLTVPANAPRIEIPPSSIDACGPTFQGRDDMAPAAARLSLGAPLASIGPEQREPLRQLSLPAWHRDPDGLHGEIIHIDHFGNAITNIPIAEAALGEKRQTAYCGRADFHSQKTYSGSNADGTGLLIPNSCGLLELALNGGSAAQRFNLQKGNAVLIKAMPQPSGEQP